MPDLLLSLPGISSPTRETQEQNKSCVLTQGNQKDLGISNTIIPGKMLLACLSWCAGTTFLGCLWGAPAKKPGQSPCCYWHLLCMWDTLKSLPFELSGAIKKQERFQELFHAVR